MSQTTQDRGEYILAQLYEKGRVAVKDLASELAVSEATVRRDLRSLAERGAVEIVYGGAALPRTRDYSYRSKGMRNVEAKRAIGQLAASLVTDNEQIFVDSGTTCSQMAPHLKGLAGVSIIVNSAALALELDTPGLNVIMLGGQYRPSRMDTVGPMATAALGELRGYIAFIGADGLSREFGLSASDLDSAHLYALAVRNSRKAVLLIDHSKFLAPSLFKIVDFAAISQVVTDRRPNDEWMSYFEELGVEVLYPDPPPDDAEAD